MASIGAFKSYQRSPRQLDVEENYARGISYTDSPQVEGFCKALVNFDMKDKGQIIIPRPGYRNLHTSQQDAMAHTQKVHHIGRTIITNPVTNEDESVQYVFTTGDDTETEYTDFNNAATLLEAVFVPEEDDATSMFTPAPHVVPATEEFLIRRNVRSVPARLHNVSLSQDDTFRQSKYNPVYTRLNGITILPVKYTVSDAEEVDPDVVKYGFAKMILAKNEGAATTNALEFIEPKEITPTTAVNYGYNMLAEAPYTFVDQINASVGAGYLIMQGIAPYAEPACTNLKFNAKVGEWLTFRLYADFHDTVDEFVFRWEIRDLQSEDVTVYENQLTTANSYKYVAGTTNAAVNQLDSSSFIKLTLQPPYKQFGVTVIAYLVADRTEPIQVMTLGSYSMTADSPGSTQGITPRTYPLNTATDMCTWRQRVVLWGVTGAPNIVFMSDTNDPSYFPYPNNALLFDEEVISCVPYLGNLLVFTQVQLYKVTIGQDGASFKTEVIQEKLMLSAFDKETILLVQNMVYFKNGNQFYMVVPRTSAAQPGALQLAPISTPISYLLDHFDTEIQDLVWKLYNPYDSSRYPHTTENTKYALRLQDYHNYVDAAIVRNVYKYELVIKDITTGAVEAVILTFDFLLNYDAAMRIWTTYITQGNDTRMLPYRQTVAEAPVFVQIRNTTTALYYDFIKPDTTRIVDNAPISSALFIQSRVFKNYQLLDTGYRDQRSTHKKRYREFNFSINMVDQLTLQFGASFMLDDQVRKELYAYEPRQITDVNSAEYGYIYVDRVYADPLIAAGATVLDDDTPEAPAIPGEYVVIDDTIMIQSSKWVLDVSKLAPVSSTKVKMAISGKGYVPRIILVSFNEAQYELLRHVWVYRTMNAR